jgi:hypothetical protein
LKLLSRENLTERSEDELDIKYLQNYRNSVPLPWKSKVKTPKGRASYAGTISGIQHGQKSKVL